MSWFAGRFSTFVSVGALALGVALVCAWSQLAVAAAGSTSTGTMARHALVIGNSNYATMPLDNPVNDARAIAKTLEAIGFRVIKIENATLKATHEAIRAFGDTLQASGGVGLFYYAGHGVQIKGNNYLLPVDQSIRREDEVAYSAVDANAILAKMESANNPLNIMILDACRDNPFVRSSRSAAVGLAHMQAPVGSLIAFATAPGAPASDGSGRNSVYTEHLLREMLEPGLPVEEVFKRVRIGVRTATGGKQIPWENTSLEHNFYFVVSASTTVAGAGPTPPPREDPQVLEQQVWSAVQRSSNPRDYQVYLERYPNGRYVNEARDRMTTITQVAVARPTGPVVGRSDGSGTSAGFSFSAAEEKTRREVEGPHVAYAEALQTPCAPARKRARISLDVGENYLHRGGGTASKGGGAFTAGLADRLRRAGLNVTTASAADYYLRGTITSASGVNRLLRLNEVSLTAALYLSSASGKAVSEVVSREDSFAGNDTSAAVVDLLRRQADAVAAKLYTDFCRAA